MKLNDNPKIKNRKFNLFGIIPSFKSYIDAARIKINEKIIGIIKILLEYIINNKIFIIY